VNASNSKSDLVQSIFSVNDAAMLPEYSSYCLSYLKGRSLVEPPYSYFNR